MCSTQWGGHSPPYSTAGADFHEALRPPPSAIVVTKGQDPDHPGHSAFQGRTSTGRTLLEDLRERKVDRLLVGGLATDSCVKHSVLDAFGHGFAVTLWPTPSGVEMQPATQRARSTKCGVRGQKFRRVDRITPCPFCVIPFTLTSGR